MSGAYRSTTRAATPAQKAASAANASRGRAARTAAAVERRKRYAALLAGGYTIQEAAWELRISYRQALRYEAQLRRGSAVARGPTRHRISAARGF